MPDIFLSYTREDQAAAQRFAGGFTTEGLTVWWDATLRSGEAYDEVTEEALRSAKAVVVLWSTKSVASRWVRSEATLADRNRTLVPALIEPCERPIMFELTQTADLSHWTGDAHDPAWRAFVADVLRVVRGEAPAAPIQPSPPPPPPLAPYGLRPAIAVLPFANRSGLQDDHGFTADLADDLTAALSASPWLKVVASHATAKYRADSCDLRRLGRELGVRYLVEGNVRAADEVVRVSVQLIEAHGDGILWTRKFDRTPGDLLRAQDDFAAEVAAQIAVQVQQAEMAHAQRKQVGITAWDALKRSQSHASDGGQAAREASVAEARRAVELAPDDGAAHAWLASYQANLLHHRGGADPEMAQEIAQHVERARALDPANPEVLSGVALTLAWLRKPHDALPIAKRAVAITPDAEFARFTLGLVLAMLGRSDEALAELDAVERVAPNGIMACRCSKWRSIALLQAGRLDQALDAAERSLQLLPDAESRLQDVLCLAKAGAWDRAREALRRLREAEPDLSRSLAASLVRDLYCGSTAAEDCVATLDRAWAEAAGDQLRTT